MIWILAVSVCGTALSASAENTQTGGALTAAQAEQTTTLSDTETDADTAAELELFLPESYEQYLDLENPSDFAINEKYKAIADQNSIYIYSVEERAYKKYTHTSENLLSSLNFYTVGNKTYLYFLENSILKVFYIDCDADEYTAMPTDLTCSSFIICQNELYYATTGSDISFFKTTLSDTEISSEVQELTLGGEPPQSSPITPAFAFCGGTLYFSYNSTIYSLTPPNTTATRQPWQIDSSVKSFAVYGNTVYYSTTSSSENFYIYQNNDNAPLSENNTPITGVPAIELYGNELFYIQDNSVQTLNLAAANMDELFTDYEICKNSSGEKRIGNATDISIYGNKIVIADTSNSRVLLYDTATHTYTNRTLSFRPTLVSAGEDTFAVSDGEDFYIYGYDAADSLYSHSSDAAIYDFVYLFGNYYLITGTSERHCVIERTGDTFTMRIPEKSFTLDFDSIAADIYGNLYLLKDNAVYPLHADNFLNSDVGSSILTFDIQVSSLLSDFEGNLYALTSAGSAILRYDRNDRVVAQIPLIGNSSADGTYNSLEDVVFWDSTASGSPTALSFTFDIESGDVYILSDGFIVRAQLGTNAPASLNSIDADGLYDTMYNAVLDSGSAEDLLVNVPAGSVLLAAGSGITSSTAVFPYAGYERTDEARAGVRVCELDAGTVVAFYEYIPAQSAGAPPTRTYSLCLVLKNDSLPLESLAGYTAAETPFAGYTTHAIGLYRFPLLQTGGSAVYSGGTQLEHTQMVTVLGTISYSVASDAEGYGLDFEYYFVRVGSGDSAVYGFVPKNYIIDYYAPSSWDGEEFTFRYVRRGEEITLQNGGEPITLGGDTRVKVYGEPDENNMVNVTYTDADGNVWSGLVNADLLYEATPSVLIVLVIVLVVTAAVIVSTCYLILRKQPTLQ